MTTTWLRHAGRHVHHTAANYLRTQLDDLDWLGTDPNVAVPFGSPPVQLLTTPVILGEKLAEIVKPGTVAITLGDELTPAMEEMGGPLASQGYPLFVDVFSDTEETTLALATDVRDIFMGRLPGTQRFLDVINQATSIVAPGWQMEFEDVERVRPEMKLPLYWQVVKVTATTYFPEVTY